MISSTDDTPPPFFRFLYVRVPKTEKTARPGQETMPARQLHPTTADHRAFIPQSNLRTNVLLWGCRSLLWGCRSLLWCRSLL